MVGEGIWQEEFRSFPHGGRGAALWVVRKQGDGAGAPLQLLCTWSTGRDMPAVARQQIPLGAMAQVVRNGVAEKVPVAAARSDDAGLWLWTEPLGATTRPSGACALIFDDTAPWGAAVRLWMERFTARLGPMLEYLQRWSSVGRTAVTGASAADAALIAGTPTLFSADQLSVVDRRRGTRRPATGITLPRPVFIRGLPGAVGVSEAMVELGESIGRIAASGVNVLLRGESGTGKEIIAQAIHLASLRHERPLVGINAAALPENLFESELFGHRAGAFTGANNDKKGLLEAASGGTFFLDEIGDMPVTLQIKLLRVMQERRVRRIGELESRPVDIRFVAATHKDLEKEIAAGCFRLDLYYRLKVVCLEIPPLRQRPEDITHLLAFFLGTCRGAGPERRISERALTALQLYRWPGNVRELENEVRRLLALFPDDTLIRHDQLSPAIRRAQGWLADPADLTMLRRLDQAGELLEQYLIRKAIAATDGRKAAAARRLGLSRQGLYKKIQRYGMTDLINGGRDSRYGVVGAGADSTRSTTVGADNDANNGTDGHPAADPAVDHATDHADDPAASVPADTGLTARQAAS